MIRFFEFRDSFTDELKEGQIVRNVRDTNAVDELNQYIRMHPNVIIKNVEYRVVYVKEFAHAQTHILLEVEE